MARFIRAVIFDCDGVLVDSEMLSAGVLMEMMAEIELPITPEIFRSDFLGRSFAAAALRAEQRFGRPLPADFQTNYRSRLLRRMAADLQPMTGVRALLQRMQAPFCLATSSSPAAPGGLARCHRARALLCRHGLHGLGGAPRQTRARSVPLRGRAARRQAAGLPGDRGQRNGNPRGAGGRNGGVALCGRRTYPRGLSPSGWRGSGTPGGEHGRAGGEASRNLAFADRAAYR